MEVVLWAAVVGQSAVDGHGCSSRCFRSWVSAAAIGCVGGLVRDGEVVRVMGDGSGTVGGGVSGAEKLVKSRDGVRRGGRLQSAIAVGLLGASELLGTGKGRSLFG